MRFVQRFGIYFGFQRLINLENVLRKARIRFEGADGGWVCVTMFREVGGDVRRFFGFGGGGAGGLEGVIVGCGVFELRVLAVD